MSKFQYAASSQYSSTPQSSWCLGLWPGISIPNDSSDTYQTITSKYDYNPGLLAYELYDDVKLWWVFVVMNPDILIDPIYDFVAGTKIRVATNTRIKDIIG